MSNSKAIRNMSLEERLLSHRRIEGDCWIWTGSNNGKYGQIRWNHRLEFVHRMSARVYLGFDTNINLQVNHTCPNTLCFNPDHLYNGSQSENLRDAYRDGRQVKGGFKPNNYLGKERQSNE